MEVREPSAKYLLGAGVKHTDLGLLPEDWFCEEIGTFVDLLTGFPFPSYGYTYAGIRLLRGSNVKRGCTDWSADLTMYWPEVTADIRKYLLAVGDVVIAMDGSLVGRSFAALGEADIPALLLQRVARLRSQRVLQEYLKTWVCSAKFTEHCAALKTTTAIPHISPQNIKAFKIAVPSTKEEQQAIATALSDAEALIESLEQLLAKKRQIKQGAMQELLTAQRRLSGFEGEWIVRTVESIAEVKTGPFGSTLHERDYVQSGTPIIAVEHIGEFGITLQNLPLVSDEDARRLRPYSLEAGDIVFSRVGAVDRNALIRESENGWLFSGRLLRVRPNKNAVNPAFLSFQFHSEAFRNAVLAVAVGQTMASLNTRILSELLVRLPTLEEQTAIAQVLADMDADIAAVETRLTKARAIKQGMMRELLTGRIRLLSPSATVLSFPAAPVEPPPPARPHNVQFEEAALLGMLAGMFGSEKFPLARVRRTKLLYLLHRRHEGIAEGYLKKAAGPYNHKTRYDGGEGIALKRGYVRSVHNGQYEGLMAGAKLAEAEAYVEKWHGPELRTWLAQFHYEKTEALELLATVDMAMVEIRRSGRQLSVDAVRQLIAADPEWRKKLEREIFSDDHIAQAIARSVDLFGEA